MELKEIEIKKIKPNPQQPREHFDRKKLKELSDSIKEIGLINPITVRKKGKQYEIVTGERRWKAHQIANKKKILAINKEYENEGQVAIESLIENIQREDLNPLEKAKFLSFIECKIRKKNPSATVADICSQLSIPQRTRASWLALLKQPKEVQKAVQEGKIGIGSAQEIYELPDEDQKEIAKEAIKREDGIGKSEINKIVETKKLYADAEYSEGGYERTARNAIEEFYDWVSNGTHLINELAKDLNLEDLEQEDRDQSITSIGVLIFNTFPKLTKALIKAGAKPDKKILELMEKTKKK